MKYLNLKVILILLLFLTYSLFFLYLTPISLSQSIIRVPEEYVTIQEAINMANPGDTIIVSKGRYFEHLIITKKGLKLLGEDSKTTIIDGNLTGPVIEVSADDVVITGFTITGSGNNSEGIYLCCSNDCMVSNNVICDCYVGIRLKSSIGIKIVENEIVNNSDSGIILTVKTVETFIRRNKIINNRYVGINLLAYADNNTIDANLLLNHSYSGVYLFYSAGNVISGNIIMENECGILINSATQNTVNNNVIVTNKCGVLIWEQPLSGNVLYYNDFVNNVDHLCLKTISEKEENRWNNEANEGNYWSDYEGEDLDGNGVGDTKTPHLGVDFFPLINPKNPIPVIFNGQLHHLTLRSNSVLSRFYCNVSLKEIGFNVVGPSCTAAYCNVTIPKSLLEPSSSELWVVTLDGNTLNAVVTENDTSTSLYFTYHNSIHRIKISLKVKSNPPLCDIGIAVGIVVALIFFLVLVIFFLKYRSKKKIQREEK